MNVRAPDDKLIKRTEEALLWCELYLHRLQEGRQEVRSYGFNKRTGESSNTKQNMESVATYL